MLFSRLFRHTVKQAKHVTAGVGRGLGRLWGTRRASFHGGYLDPPNFVNAVLRAAATPQSRRERLHVFSLGDFRQAAGGKWERIAGLVEIASDSIFRRHIDPKTDMYTRIDADTSLLAIMRTSRQESRVCVAAIAHDLAAYLFGDTLIEGRRPQVVAANINVRDAVTASGELNAPALREVVTKASAALAPHPAPGLSPPHRATLAALLTEAKISPLTDDDDPTPQADQADGTGGSEPGWLDFHLHRRAEDALMGEQTLLPESVLSLVWTPTWTIGRHAVAAFQARVIRVDGEGQPPLEGVHAYDGTAPLGALTIDRFIAAQAAHELRDLAFIRQRMELVLPIHWTSLAPRWRDYLMAPLQDCPATSRRKLLKIEVFGLTPSIPTTEFRDLIEPLEALGCDLLIRLPLATPCMVPTTPLLRAVGADLAELGEEERVGDDELFRRAQQLRQIARRSGCGCYLWGVRRRTLIAKLLRADFVMVNGPGVMCDIGRPYASGNAARRTA